MGGAGRRQPDDGAGAARVRGKAERAGNAQPGEEAARGGGVTSTGRDAQREGTEKREPGSSQQSLPAGQEPTGTNEKPQIPSERKKNNFPVRLVKHWHGLPNLSSILEDIQHMMGHSPGL